MLTDYLANKSIRLFERRDGKLEGADDFIFGYS